MSRFSEFLEKFSNGEAAVEEVIRGCKEANVNAGNIPARKFSEIYGCIQEGIHMILESPEEKHDGVQQLIRQSIFEQTADLNVNEESRQLLTDVLYANLYLPLEKEALDLDKVITKAQFAGKKLSR